MSKGLKILLGVLSGLLVLLMGVFFLVNVVYEPEPEPLVFPQGELSDSIFVEQNNVYTENSSLGGSYSFGTVPYKVDVSSDAQGAKIGDGKVYQINNSMFVYVTEFDDMTQVEDASTRDKVVQMQDILSSQFPAALLINYIPEETLVTAQASGDGFINGFNAHYLADSIGITDGAQTVSAALLGYILDVDERGFEGRHMYVSVGTTDLTNDALRNSAAVLSAIMKTVRYDQELYEAMIEGMDIPSDEQASEEVASVESTDAEPAKEDVFEKTIYSANDDATLQVNISWENDNPDAILELFLPGGDQFCEPLNQSGTAAQFVLANAPAGDYVLRIKNYEACGEVWDGTSSVGAADYNESESYESSDYEVMDLSSKSNYPERSSSDYDSDDEGEDSSATDGGID